MFAKSYFIPYLCPRRKERTMYVKKTKEERSPNLGGIRPNAGRKSKYVTNLTRTISIRVTNDIYDYYVRLRSHGFNVTAEFSAMIRGLCYDEGLMNDGERENYENTSD